MDNITLYEQIKKFSIEEMAVFICNIQMDVINTIYPDLEENREEHCKRLLKYLESEVYDE